MVCAEIVKESGAANVPLERNLLVNLIKTKLMMVHTVIAVTARVTIFMLKQLTMIINVTHVVLFTAIHAMCMQMMKRLSAASKMLITSTSLLTLTRGKARWTSVVENLCILEVKLLLQILNQQYLLVKMRGTIK